MSRDPSMLRATFFRIAACALLLLAACARAQPTPYRPPTQDLFTTPPVEPVKPVAILATAEPTLVKAPRATATPPCAPGLTFLKDLTIPDGTLVAPGDVLDKRWQVENTGTCNWDENYRLKLIAGPDLGAPGEQALFPARGGSEALIRMLFTAPDEPGVYRSAWQGHDPDGSAFGDPFFIEILVASP